MTVAGAGSANTVMTRADDESDYLNTAEVAVIYRRAPKTIRAWRYLGTGPKYRTINGRALYKRADVIAWIDEQS